MVWVSIMGKNHSLILSEGLLPTYAADIRSNSREHVTYPLDTPHLDHMAAWFLTTNTAA